MSDLITHVSNIYDMQKEGYEIAQDENHPLNSLFTVDTDGDLTFNVSKIPVHYTDRGETLCLVRGLERSDFDGVESINIIGECVGDTLEEKQYIFDGDDDKSTYERVRGSLEYVYTDENGINHDMKKPYMIGVFA